MSTINASRIYSKSEFTGTAPSGTPNVNIFRIEVGALSLSEQPFSVYESGNDIILEWSVLPIASDFSTIDSAVTSHVGGLISGSTKFEVSENSQDNSSTTPNTAVELTSGLLVGGTYSIDWYCETLVASSSISSVVSFEIDTGSGYSQFGRKESVLLVEDPFSGRYVINNNDGDSINARITFARAGGLSLNATVQRARLILTRIS